MVGVLPTAPLATDRGRASAKRPEAVGWGIPKTPPQRLQRPGAGHQELSLMPAAPYPTVQRRARIETRRARLGELGYRDYATYLRSPAWMDTRRRYFDSDQPQDCICGALHELQLHHLTYERVGEEELTDLTPLCPRCHSMLHELERRGEVGLDFQGFVNEERARLHREAEARRRAKRLDGEAEMRRERDLERVHSRLKANFDRIRGAARHCINNGIDVDEEMASLDALAKAFEDKR